LKRGRRFYITYREVEAAGIEPASENVQQKSLHACQVRFFLTPSEIEPATSPDASPLNFALNRRASNSELAHISRRSIENLRAGFLQNVTAIKRLVLTQSQQLFVFHGFNEERGTSACISCLFASVETGAPPGRSLYLLHISIQVEPSLLSILRSPGPGPGIMSPIIHWK